MGMMDVTKLMSDGGLVLDLDLINEGDFLVIRPSYTDNTLCCLVIKKNG